MKILAIETATEACSAALAIDDSCLERFQLAPRQHTQLILPMIDELIQEADIKIDDLDALAFGQGPGAFTGVRIAIGVIQGLAFAHDLPVIPVSTLAALAQHVADKHDFVASAIDARMQEIYWGLYKKNESGLMEVINEESVLSPENIDFATISEENWFGVGSGWETYSEILEPKFSCHLKGFEADIFPSAVDILSLAKPTFKANKQISIEEATPVYLRNKVASKKQ
jgi:tRNA threonylcarbamoyladenosine biosynthesis protein TsaB